MTFGRPTSPSSITPGVPPPPGLKSRQTTPLMPPCSGSGVVAVSAPFGISAARIAVRPSEIVPPGSTGALASSPVVVVPSSASVEGRAVESAPGSTKTSRTACTPAFTAPRSGSWMYMMRQVIPAANAEIAIGMKTAVLKATAQPTRSVSTANTIPNAVTLAGTTSTQMKLFLIAVTRMSLVNSSR